MTTSGLLVIAFGLAMMAYGISPWVSYRSKALATREGKQGLVFRRACSGRLWGHERESDDYGSPSGDID